MGRGFIRTLALLVAIGGGAFLPAQPVALAEETSVVDHVMLRYEELDALWSIYVSESGVRYVSPDVYIVVGAEQGVDTGSVDDHIVLQAEPAQSTYGPVNDTLGKSFYDIGENAIFLMYEDISYQWSNYGDFAVSFLIAHEWGHHISNLMYAPDFKALYDQSNQNKTFFELQADCYAGMYAYAVDSLGGLEVGDIEEAYEWVGDIGSDVGGNTDSSTWTHGSSAQRVESFWHGYSTNQCEAYSGLSGGPPTQVQQSACANNPIAVSCEELTGETQSTDEQFEAGWYDPYGYGCLYWYDGTQYTEYVDCDADGYADNTESSENVVGWYGPYSDGCYYWGDGAQFNGQVDCNGDGYADEASSSDDAIDCDHNVIAVPCDEQQNPGAGSGTSAGWYGPFNDGCYYWWDGAQYNGQVDCNGDGYVDQ